MQITGTARMTANQQTAWEAFHDTGVLQRTIPGVESFIEVEPGRYQVVVGLGIASIKGRYKGDVAFAEEVEPEAFTLTLQAAGGAGTIGAEVDVRLSPADDGGCEVAWSADAIVGGAIGGVGQRMLVGVSKRMAAKFFADIDAEITGARTPTAVSDAADAPSGGQPSRHAAAGDAARSGSPRIEAPPSAASPLGFALGMAMGAGIALAGVAVGAALGRR